MPQRLRTGLWLLVFLGPALVILAVFQYYPLLSAVRFSFYQYNLLAPEDASFTGLQNYSRLLHDHVFLISLGNTLAYTGLKLVIQLPLSLILALLVQQKIRGVGIIRSAIFAPTVTAVSIAAVVWNLMYNPDHGFFNSMLSAVHLAKQDFLTSNHEALASIMLMSVWQDTGLTMLILLAGLQAIPDDFYEAAKVDGANGWQLMRSITLPLLRRTILYAVVITTILAFKVFTPIYIMTQGGPLNSTMMSVYYIFQQAFINLDMGYACALAIILIAILLVIAVVQSRLLRTQFEY